MKKTITKKPVRKTISKPKKTRDTYEKDFYAWTQSQMQFLKKGEFSRLDLEHLVEEIRSLGISEKRAIESHCVVLLTHMLKQRHQPAKDCNSWRSSIANARMEIKLLLDYSPSLKQTLKKNFPSAYQKAVNIASYETQLPLEVFDESCPWTIAESLGI